MSLRGLGYAGTGIEFGREVGADGRVLRSDREEKITAVAAAPVAAEMPAMIARVVFDILTFTNGYLIVAEAVRRAYSPYEALIVYDQATKKAGARWIDVSDSCRKPSTNHLVRRRSIRGEP